jgi:hypothetical protein
MKIGSQFLRTNETRVVSYDFRGRIENSGLFRQEALHWDWGEKKLDARSTWNHSDVNLAGICGGIYWRKTPTWKGSKDHPLISRFPGSRIIGYMQKDWNQTRFPLSNEISDNKEIKKASTVEDKITRIVYVAPAGKSPLEVHRNYEQALLAAGIIRKFGCERNFGQLFWAWRFGAFRNSLTWSDSGVKSRDGSSSWNSQDAISDGEGRCLYGT